MRCLSEYYSRFKGRSEREIHLSTAELRRQHRQQAGKFSVRARALAGFLDSPAGQGTVAAQQERDAEARALHAVLGRLDQPNLDETPGPEIPVGEAPILAEEPGQAVALEAYEDF